jgi:hypothetical protein
METDQMRITRRQLRRIIKEEKRKLLKEMGPGPRDDVKNDYDSGFDDWLAGEQFVPEPLMPDNPDYMEGWHAAENYQKTGSRE